MNIVLPGKTSHPVIAMVSTGPTDWTAIPDKPFSPSPFSLVGDGAGSIFKIFTTAAALDLGLGISATLDVPAVSRPKGARRGRRQRGLSEETWCVENYRDPATSPMGSPRPWRSHPTRRSRAHLPGRRGPHRGHGRPVGAAFYTEPGTARVMTPTTTRVWPISSNARISGRSPWARSR